MFRIYLLTTITIFMFGGCGWFTSEAGNSNDAVNNGNVADANANSNANVNVVEDEEVPRFTDAKTALEKGIAYLEDTKIAKAIDALTQATELDPDMADAHFQLGVAYSLKEAEEENLVVEDPSAEETPEKAKKKAEKPNSEKAFENAVKAYKKVISKDREDHAAYFNLGRAYSKLFDDTEARKALEQAVKLNGDDTQYRTELGAALIKLAQYPEAVKQLKKALELDEANYRADDLLTQAEAGKKRVDFAQPDKSGSSSSSSSSTKETPSSRSSRSGTSTKPEKETPEASKSPEKKPDKKPETPKKN